MLICQCHQTILSLLSSATTASTQWRVRELYCPTTYEMEHHITQVPATQLPHTSKAMKDGVGGEGGNHFQHEITKYHYFHHTLLNSTFIGHHCQP